jgi:Zn-dependent M16 (insulinase) family peptidase
MTASRKPLYRKVQSFRTDYAPATITLYESERSGMQVIVADRKGPKVNGYFTLATEILDSSGAPHTLEHLVFMGSKSYPYKGLLDKLAGRAYSHTNAWTAVDHTAYTLESAGWDGFAQILPVYLEHVIVPNLTDDACLTEVHHIDGEGNDAGVVYSEMQGVQYNSPEIMDRRARQLLYPENIGFRYETGGMMEALRVLTPERIRSFHKAMYQPQNLAVIIVGEVDHDHLLRILDEFEENIKDDIPPPDPNFKRPFVDSPQPPPLTKTVVETVEFPEEDESTGDVLVAFFGPSCIDQIEITAMAVLLTYLCGSSVSVLENTIVEKEQLASSVTYWWDNRPNSVIWIQPTGVATESSKSSSNASSPCSRRSPRNPSTWTTCASASNASSARSGFRPRILRSFTLAISLLTTCSAAATAPPSKTWRHYASTMSSPAGPSSSGATS